MKSSETRSHRLNYLLRFYQKYSNEEQLYFKAFGVNEITAKDYVRTVIIQANKWRKKD